jgi:capsule polysaccharide modification protein KpsS
MRRCAAAAQNQACQLTCIPLQSGVVISVFIHCPFTVCGQWVYNIQVLACGPRSEHFWRKQRLFPKLGSALVHIHVEHPVLYSASVNRVR